ncbi:MAG TPA: hypothetical protein VLZ28_06385 [Daejeonella sp.]|nr:hypothetical protein [Daejeonella sp.]
MKSQYPHDLSTCQTTEPSDYLSTYSGIRQISKKKLEIMKADYNGLSRKKKAKPFSILGKAEDEGLGSFFYRETFKLNSDE